MNWKFTKYCFDRNDLEAINIARDAFSDQYIKAAKDNPGINLNWVDGFDAGFWRGLSYGIYKRINHGPCAHNSVMIVDGHTFCKSCHSILNDIKVYQNTIEETPQPTSQRKE